MTFRQQQYSAGQVISSQKLNRLGENDNLVRRLHYGPEQPDELSEGIWWIDTTSSPYEVKIYTGSHWLLVGKIHPDSLAYGVNAEHVTDADQPVIDETTILITTVVSQSTWESIGPTGSGADNIWTAMDDVPKTSSWVRLRINAQVTESSGAIVTLSMHARKTGSSVAIAANNRIVLLQRRAPSATSVEMDKIVEAYVPVDGENRFDAYWVRDDGTGSTINAYLTGYGVNSPSPGTAT